MNNKVNFIDDIQSVNNKHIFLKDIIDKIKTDENLKVLTQEVRNNITDIKAYKEFKKKLPVVNFSSLMKYGYIHSIINIETHTNILVLDYDHFNSVEEIEDICAKLRNDERVLFIYRSASNLGIKLGVNVNLDALISIDSEDTDIEINEKYNTIYKKYYEYVDTLFFDITKINADSNAKDISRCSYITYDTDVYFNLKSSVIKMDKDFIEKQTDEDIFLKSNNEYENDVDTSYSDECNYLLNFTRKNKLTIAENYNNWLYFANLLSKVFPSQEALTRFHYISEICDNYNKDDVDKKMKNIIKNPTRGTTNIITFYKLLSDSGHRLDRKDILKEIDNHKLAQISKYIDEDEVDESVLLNTPYIRDEIYTLLPSLIKDMCSNFTDKRDRDVFFTSLLVSLSAVFENVKGLWHGSEVSLNLFTYVVAPASAGKGNAKFAVRVTEGIDKILKDEYNKKVKNLLDEYENEDEEIDAGLYEESGIMKSIIENDKNKSGKRKNKKPDIDSIPKKCFQLPENTSDRALFDKLNSNSGGGLMYLSETDTLVNNRNNDWAKNLTVLMRKAIHNEPHDLSRKGEDLKVDNVKMSLILTSTLSTLTEFIKSEDGTLSRFLFYIYEKEFVFKGGFSQPNKTQIFANYQSTIADMYEYYRNLSVSLISENPAEFDKMFEELFNKKYKKLNLIFNNKDIEAVITRYGLIAYRIAYIFQLVEEYSHKDVFNNEISKEVILKTKYLKLSLNLILIYLKHTEVVFYNTSENKQIQFKSNNNEKLIKYIKNIKTPFDSAKIKKQALDKYNIKDSTVKSILAKMVKQGELIKISKILYQNK